MRRRGGGDGRERGRAGEGRHDEVGRQRRTRTRQPVTATTVTAGDRKKRQSADDGGGRDGRAGSGGCGGRRRVRWPMEARGGGGGGARSPSHRRSQRAGRPGEPSDLGGRRRRPASTQSDISPGGGSLRRSTTTLRSRDRSAHDDVPSPPIRRPEHDGARSGPRDGGGSRRVADGAFEFEGAGGGTDSTVKDEDGL